MELTLIRESDGNLLTSFWTTCRCDWMEALSHLPFARWCDRLGIYIFFFQNKRKTPIKSPDLFAGKWVLHLKTSPLGFELQRQLTWKCHFVNTGGVVWFRRVKTGWAAARPKACWVTFLIQGDNQFLFFSFSHTCFLKCWWMFQPYRDPLLNLGHCRNSEGDVYCQ